MLTHKPIPYSTARDKSLKVGDPLLRLSDEQQQDRGARAHELNIQCLENKVMRAYSLTLRN